MVDMIDYNGLMSNPNFEVDGKWVSYDMVNGLHVEGLAFTDNRGCICVHAYNLGEDMSNKVLERLGGGAYHPVSFVIAASLRIIEPSSMPRLVLNDNTMLTGTFKANAVLTSAVVSIRLLHGVVLDVPVSSIKYVVRDASGVSTASNSNQ